VVTVPGGGTGIIGLLSFVGIVRTAPELGVNGAVPFSIGTDMISFAPNGLWGAITPAAPFTGTVFPNGIVFTGATRFTSPGINSVLRAGPSDALNGIAFPVLNGGIGEVVFNTGDDELPNPDAAGGGGGAVIIPAEGTTGILLPPNGGNPPTFGTGALGTGALGNGGKPPTLGSGALGNGGRPPTLGTGALGNGGKPPTLGSGALGKGGRPPTLGTGALGNGGKPPTLGTGAFGNGGISDPPLAGGTNTGTEPSIFFTGASGIKGAPGRGGITPEPFTSSPVVNLISFLGTGTKSIPAVVMGVT